MVRWPSPHQLDVVHRALGVPFLALGDEQIAERDPLHFEGRRRFDHLITNHSPHA